MNSSYKSNRASPVSSIKQANNSPPPLTFGMKISKGPGHSFVRNFADQRRQAKVKAEFEESINREPMEEDVTAEDTLQMMHMMAHSLEEMLKKW